MVLYPGLVVEKLTTCLGFLLSCAAVVRLRPQGQGTAFRCLLLVVSSHRELILSLSQSLSRPTQYRLAYLTESLE